MHQETVMGMVLSAMPMGEYDKRLVILTKEYGKISAFAKGARKPNCALLACSQPFSFGEFTLYQGRNSYTVVSANISNYFGELRSDLEGVYYGFYFCEFADYVTRENMNATDILKLLYQSLRVLTKKTIPASLIRYIFELKIMFFNGEAPQVFECVSCKKQQETYLFSCSRGGLVCPSCRGNADDGIRLSEAAVYTMQFIVATSIEKLYTFTVSNVVLRELESCMKQYLESYIGHKFKSLDMIGFIT